jgi:hypothetical protein
VWGCCSAELFTTLRVSSLSATCTGDSSGEVRSEGRTQASAQGRAKGAGQAGGRAAKGGRPALAQPLG